MNRSVEVSVLARCFAMALLLTVASGSAVLATSWCEGFEGYSAESFPGGPWSYTGNSDITVDNSTAHSGGNSLRTYGVLGSCWAGIAVHPLGETFPITVEVSIRNGTEDLYGCNPFRAYMSVFTGSQWTQGPQVEGFVVLENGDFQARAATYTVLTNLSANQWHRIRIEYSRPNDGLLHAQYWVNGTYYGDFSRPWEQWMAGLGYLHVGAIEGTAWFDDICVKPGPPPVTEVAFDIKPGSCPNPVNIKPAPPHFEEPAGDSSAVVSVAKLAPLRVTPPPEVLPVAVLGTSTFNAASIDVSTVKLIGIAPIRSSLEDVSTPVAPGSAECACSAAGGDGFTDLTLKFNRDAIVGALGPVNVGDVKTLKITGKLTDGSDFEGSDCVVIVGNPGTAESGTAGANALELANYPNPFNPTTTISFSLPEASYVSLKVYNSLGQEVATLLDERRDAGTHRVTWDAGSCASGVYFYRLTTRDFTDTRKMLLMK